MTGTRATYKVTVTSPIVSDELSVHENGAELLFGFIPVFIFALLWNSEEFIPTPSSNQQRQGEINKIQEKG